MKRDGSVFAVVSLCSALLALVAASARAEAPQTGTKCNCDQYESFTKFGSLADEMAAIGPRAIHPGDGSPMENAEAERQALTLRIKSNTLIPDECKPKLLSKINGFHASVFARVLVGKTPGQAAPEAGEALSLYYGYNSLYSSYLYTQQSASCHYGSPASCYQNATATAWGNFGGVLSAAAGTSVGYSGIHGDQLKIMAAYHDVLSSGGEANMLAYLKAGKDGLTDKQFLTLVSMVGQRLGEDYDYARIDLKSDHSKGIVTGDQLLTAAAANTMNGYNTGASAGVCRDIAALQAKMLDAHGFPNAYVLGYGTIGGGHAIAIAGDRKDPTAFYGFSYDLMTATSGLDGSEALFQRNSPASIGYPDAALNYNISKPGGMMVATVPSSMGKFLEEAAGYDIHQIDPLARETSSLLGAGTSWTSQSGKTNVSVRVVAGQDGVGSQYVGGSAKVGWAQGTLAPGSVGIFVGQQTRPGAVFGMGDSPSGDAKAGLLYLQADQHVMTPDIKIGQKTTLKIDNSLTAMGVVGKIMSGNGADQGNVDGAPPLILGGDVRLRSEARIDQDLGKVHSTYRGGLILGPGSKDERSGDPSNFVTVSLDDAYLGTTQTLRVKDMLLFADATVAANLLGSRGIAEVGVAGSKWAASAWVAGRLTGPLYEDNTLRRVGVSAMVRPVKQLQLGVTGQMPIEGDAVLSQTQLMGTAIVNF